MCKSCMCASCTTVHTVLWWTLLAVTTYIYLWKELLQICPRYAFLFSVSATLWTSHISHWDRQWAYFLQSSAILVKVEWLGTWVIGNCSQYMRHALHPFQFALPYIKVVCSSKGSWLCCLSVEYDWEPDIACSSFQFNRGRYADKSQPPCSGPCRKRSQ